MKTLAVIPARYASTRFPGKPLATIIDRPMIQMVYERVLACSEVNRVCVATDDERIYSAVRAFGGEVVMTASGHQSGTDRVAEAIQNLSAQEDLILNVQGDEPGIDAAHLQKIIRLFENSQVQIGTLVTPFQSVTDFQNPDRVKAVLSSKGRALYFSRAAAPYDQKQNAPLKHSYQHLGIYAFRREILAELTALAPSPLEQKESLEQLRWLENDYMIHAARVDRAPIGIDRPEDLKRFVRTL